jgi:hypothetical protein
MVAARRCRRRGRREAALVVIAFLALAVACTPDETLRISPDEGSMSLPQGGTGTVGVSFELPTRRNVGSVALPARVDVVGDGEHTISLEAIDRAGNQTIKDVTITIEQTTPEPTATPG